MKSNSVAFKYIKDTKGQPFQIKTKGKRKLIYNQIRYKLTWFV